MKKYAIILFVFFTIMMLVITDITAQCPMCKMVAEANMKGGGTAGKGLNTGILYLLAMPYLAVITLAYLWKRNKKKLLQ